MSEDASVEAYNTDEESWLRSIVSTTQRAVNDNMVRWIIPIRAEFVDALDDLHALARAEYARPTMILPLFLGQTSEIDERTKTTVLDFIDSRVLGRDSKLYGREE